jgi:hypothetical protein
MIKKIALATAVALSMASTVAVAAPDRGHDSLQDRQNASACERPVAPSICK